MIIDFRVRVPMRDDENSPEDAIPDFMSRYRDVFPKLLRQQPTVTDVIEQADAAGVEVMVLQAELELPQSRRFNDRVAELVARDPKRFAGIAGINPTEEGARSELVRAFDELGLRGVNVQPWAIGIPVTDDVYTPVWEEANARGLPVTIHTGVNFRSEVPLTLGDPLGIDFVAGKYPDLNLVINHGGWPWLDVALAVLWRHRNVYIEFGAVRASELVSPQGLWGRIGPLLPGWLGDRVLMATDWPMMSFSRMLADYRSLDLDPATRAKIMGGNAARLLGLELPATVSS